MTDPVTPPRAAWNIEKAIRYLGAQPLQRDLAAARLHLRQALEALTVAPERREPTREEIADALEEADQTFGYSMEMVRLIDGVRTFRLKIGESTSEITDEEENGHDAQHVCYGRIAKARAAHRAAPILALFRGGAT